MTKRKPESLKAMAHRHAEEHEGFRKALLDSADDIGGLDRVTDMHDEAIQRLSRNIVALTARVAEMETKRKSAGLVAANRLLQCAMPYPPKLHNLAGRVRALGQRAGFPNCADKDADDLDAWADASRNTLESARKAELEAKMAAHSTTWRSGDDVSDLPKVLRVDPAWTAKKTGLLRRAWEWINDQSVF